jgi:hypothetical protein
MPHPIYKAMAFSQICKHLRCRTTAMLWGTAQLAVLQLDVIEVLIANERNQPWLANIA